MASTTQIFHSSFSLHPTLKHRHGASFPLLPAKPTHSFHFNPLSLRSNHRIPALPSSSSSTLSPLPLPQSHTASPHEFLSGSTRTLATIFALALSLSRVFIKLLHPNQLAAIMGLQRNAFSTMGPLFFAALRDRPTGYLNTPLTVVAAGLAKWLDIYSGVLMVRVLLSWFPNIPWERQPLSAIRDLCDPYLNLFRNIIPPVFDTLDVSPLLAFAVLGTLGSILHGSSG
ncbi:ylmG-like protein 1-2, chloroplastic-like [Senna tora]|uniref:YlmG-like protein 1-2, chloroplastic-like n=1 Tax=Senna tora TaxID=362788 RepID=A0A834XFQ0_9FABA|nr:ylmG-like protein 1-2, chloroplastic-like [Senna tora]